MKLSRGARRALIGFGVLILLLGVAVVFAPPVIVRHALLHYLRGQGIEATIGNVDANLFTGRATVDDAHGRHDNRSVFDIGHLALTLRYTPLWDKRLSLANFSLSNSSLDVRRTESGAMRVGGITAVAKSSADKSGSSWNAGLSHLAIDGLTIRYSQPKTVNHQAVARDMVVGRLSASNIEPWNREDRVSLSAAMAVGKSHVRVAGHATPFAQKPTAHLHLRTADLDLDLLAPLTPTHVLSRLAGQIDSDQKVDIAYDPSTGLSIGLDGSASWQHAGIARSDGLTVNSKTLDWSGQLNANLLRANDQPGQVDAKGTLDVVQLETRQPETLDFRQADGHWTGQAHLALGAALQLNTDGVLATKNTQLDAPGRLTLAADQSTLKGKLDLNFGASTSRINTDGAFQAQGMKFAVPDGLDFNSQTLDWNGKTQTHLGDSATRIDTGGDMTVGALSFVVPGSSQFKTRSANWQGKTEIRSADLFARQANGQLTLDQATLQMNATPLAMTADHLIYDGRYAEQPDAAGKALRLTMDGEIDSHKMHAVNPAIDAPWFSALQLHGTGLTIDGLNQIRLAALKASGVRILGDTNTPSSVLQAVSLTASSFKLDQLFHYSVDDIALKNADIHVRRTPRGMGVISLFFGSGSESADKTSPSSQADAGGSSRSTFAIKHLALSGPAATFVDTAVTPNVKLTGSDLNFTVEDLDTARLGHGATYRLSMDAGAYGHLNSHGTIAPMAPKGVNMSIDAWLRSLAMAPLSGYMNAAMGRKIANGAADGTLHLEAKDGQLNGNLNTTLSNFRLAGGERAQTTVALGISLDSALKLVRGQNDVINFKTRIQGDVTNPYFSVKNLVREAVLAGLRTTLLSDYSPVGLVNKAKNAFLNLFRSISDRPAIFEAGRHYIRPDDREYLGHIAQAMASKPGWDLIVQGHASPGDAKALSMFQGKNTSQSGNQVTLLQLARMRGQAVRDYLAARNVNPDRIRLLDPVVDDSADARPRATFDVDESP